MADKTGTDKTTATDKGATDKGDTVLVPPAGIHTPGRTAMGGESPYVEVPADAAANPEATREAYEKAQRGEHDVALPAGVIPQAPDGSALSPEAAQQAVKDEQEQQDYVEGKGEAPAPKR